MNNPDFAKLKETLDQKIYDCQDINELAAIITELLEIIQSQSDRMNIVLNEIDEFMENRNNECDHSIDLLNKSLSETNTRLQKLREGNNE
jgi:uncharacterized coiled-coil protein SlyX